MHINTSNSINKWENKIDKQILEHFRKMTTYHKLELYLLCTVQKIRKQHNNLDRFILFLVGKTNQLQLFQQILHKLCIEVTRSRVHSVGSHPD